MLGVPHAHDMRDEVSDPEFRPLRAGVRQERTPGCWWNSKAGMFAHAVGAALDGRPQAKAFTDFKAAARKNGGSHKAVNRFAYIQIKKIGGGGTSNVAEIGEHAAKYGDTLTRQIDLYQPHLVIGCGVGKASPARLLLPLFKKCVKDTTSSTGAKWWLCEGGWGPMALLQLYHPAKRGSTADLYADVWASVREVATFLGRPSK